MVVANILFVLCSIFYSSKISAKKYTLRYFGTVFQRNLALVLTVLKNHLVKCLRLGFELSEYIQQLTLERINEHASYVLNSSPVLCCSSLMRKVKLGTGSVASLMRISFKGKNNENKKGYEKIQRRKNKLNKKTGPFLCLSRKSNLNPARPETSPRSATTKSLQLFNF